MSATQVISHWHQTIESLEASPLAFYESVEGAVQRRSLPGLQISRLDFKEGGLFSANRQYLRIVRGNYSFDICGAPFGNGFFFSWWLTNAPPAYGILYLFCFMCAMFVLELLFFKAGWFMWFFLNVFFLPLLVLAAGWIIRESASGADDALIAMPIIGALYAVIFRPATYYKVDTALMFQQSVHNAVLEVIDELTSAHGKRSLTELERKPVLSEMAK